MKNFLSLCHPDNMDAHSTSLNIKQLVQWGKFPCVNNDYRKVDLVRREYIAKFERRNRRIAHSVFSVVISSLLFEILLRECKEIVRISGFLSHTEQFKCQHFGGIELLRVQTDCRLHLRIACRRDTNDRERDARLLL